MEANEISEFSNQMKEAGEESLTHVSLIIAVLAVLVALVTVLGHREHTEAVLMQARAADTWNQYQARRLRLEVTEKVADLLSLQPSANGAAVEAKLAKYKADTDRVSGEMKENTEKAKEYEAEVDVAEHKAARYDMGEALLQIAVVLASVTLLTKQTRWVMTGLALGGIGLALAVWGAVIH